jgi:hypothetical protein
METTAEARGIAQQGRAPMDPKPIDALGDDLDRMEERETPYAIRTNWQDAKNSDETETETLDEALMIAELWAQEIVEQLREDFPGLQAGATSGGKHWLICDADGSMLRTVSVIEQRA